MTGDEDFPRNLRETVEARSRAKEATENGSRQDPANLQDRDRKAFSELIELAEKVQSERDSLKRQIYVAFGGIGFIAISAVAVLLTVYDFSSPRSFLETPAGLLAAMVILSAYAASMLFYLQASRRLRRENKAFTEVMDVVHEVYEGLKGDLSALELAETRIRLSRLDN